MAKWVVVGADLFSFQEVSLLLGRRSTASLSALPHNDCIAAFGRDGTSSVGILRQVLARRSIDCIHEFSQFVHGWCAVLWAVKPIPRSTTTRVLASSPFLEKPKA